MDAQQAEEGKEIEGEGREGEEDSLMDLISGGQSTAARMLFDAAEEAKGKKGEEEEVEEVEYVMARGPDGKITKMPVRTRGEKKKLGLVGSRKLT